MSKVIYNVYINRTDFMYFIDNDYFLLMFKDFFFEKQILQKEERQRKSSIWYFTH